MIYIPIGIIHALATFTNTSEYNTITRTIYLYTIVPNIIDLLDRAFLFIETISYSLSKFNDN